ncbi:MAG: MupA/Atu3671 family FMN-dependent luciferase-like monooxygenase [Ilumatobacter sp.]|uniref:MupA/Atu3671 family FMN-dependent luciferase-like monooxygenase n=2 Tax=Ilumatobacter sp. TaxID=1967498 RepID=UPI003299E852
MTYATISGKRCLVIGDEPLAAQCIDLAHAAGLSVVAVATVNAQVEQHADQLQITTTRSDADLVTSLGSIDFDILLSIANLRILPDALLDRADMAVNFHDGPLPGYAGLNVTTWAILNGESEHAVTWHVMTSDVDAGEIVATETFSISPDDTAFSLNARCYEAALASFPRVADALASGRVTTTAQPDTEGHLYRRGDRPSRLLDLSSDSADGLGRLVRALDLGHLSSNSIGVPLLLVGNQVLAATAAATDGSSGGEPGTIVDADDRSLIVTTADGDLRLELARADGSIAQPTEVLAGADLAVGARLTPPPSETVAALAEVDPRLAAHESFWTHRLATTTLSSTPVDDDDVAAAGDWISVQVATGSTDTTTAVAAISLWLARLNGTGHAAFAVIDTATAETMHRLGRILRPPIALVEVHDDLGTAALVGSVGTELADMSRRGPFAHDLIGRTPALKTIGTSAAVTIFVDDEPSFADVDESQLVLAVQDGTVTVFHHTSVVGPELASRLADQLTAVLTALDTDTEIGDVDILSTQERSRLDALNATAVDHDRKLTVDAGIWRQVERSPDAPAVSFGDTTLTYTELAQRAERFASDLAAAGIGRGDRVGIAVPRGLDMLVGVLATIRLGAAYVPLDPAYPAERLQYMVDDAGIAVLLARDKVARDLARADLTLLDPAEIDSSAAARTDHASTESAHDAADLAYVIYTSGSTGKPKGVMLEHRNVANFFVGMDAVIDHDEPGVWLAVTSLSFDISVLELLWTLSRGFHVVLKAESGFGTTAGTSADTSPAVTVPAVRTRPVSMSLFYFAAAQASEGDGYRLLLEGAKFADENGFEAIWSPERHFHPFGGAYPNPSVISAAIAATTKNVAIRAGSVVLPLHSPVRVAEEWAVVDNLSNGRVGISFAPGWQPNDFVLNPATYGRARSELPGLIDVVKRLWRGESVVMPGHDAEMVSVSTLPRPVQAELPIWLTSAGTPATFEQAGRSGVNVLTHLLGQSHDDLAANIVRYRTAWTEAGHDGEGHVTLMLHTFLDEDADTAKEHARGPMKAYLGTAVGLIKNMASSFPTFAGSGKDADEAFASLTEDELDQLLEMAASRYLDTSGLFGTADDAAATIATVGELGVDEVACLVDFGVDVDRVLGSFPLLKATKQQIDADPIAAPTTSATPGGATPSINDAVHDETVAALIERHDVTHMQCTPSLAAMLVANPSDRAALGSIRHLMLGGEALPVAMANELRGILPDRFTNMYGPTETTIWSLTEEIESIDGASVPIGRPIANTTILVLDDGGHRVPIGSFGELFIGGEGVARGYHDRPDLTAERFVDHNSMGRLYATGDVVRVHPSGHVEFGGRSDNQLKIRGHRIELGEIESVLDAHPSVVQSVVVPRGVGTDPFLVAFVVATGELDEQELRDHIGADLPSVMVPSAIVPLAAFPLTPNGKVDRNALPFEIRRAHDETSATAPTDDGERRIAAVWAEALGRPVGRDDNFFEIGGHSLLAVSVFRTLVDTGATIALTDLFRFPTVRTLAAHIESLDGAGTEAADDGPAVATGSARGEKRRRAMARRGGGPT